MNRRAVLAWAAIVFGLMTTFSGGSVLFGPTDLRMMAGDIVLPVLWFNFMSGPIYVVAGIGILARKPWSRSLSRLLATAIALMFLFLIFRIATGAAWEPRTLAAMTLRLGFWIAAATLPATNPKPRGA